MVLCSSTNFHGNSPTDPDGKVTLLAATELTQLAEKKTLSSMIFQCPYYRRVAKAVPMSLRKKLDTNCRHYITDTSEPRCRSLPDPFVKGNKPCLALCVPNPRLPHDTCLPWLPWPRPKKFQHREWLANTNRLASLVSSKWVEIGFPTLEVWPAWSRQLPTAGCLQSKKPAALAIGSPATLRQQRHPIVFLKWGYRQKALEISGNHPAKTKGMPLARTSSPRCRTHP